MRVLALLAVAVLAACGQGTSTSARVSYTPSPSPASGERSEPRPSPPPAPAVSCLPGVIPAFQALVLGSDGTFLYDVTDPVHPRATCRITNTVARVVTGTSFEYL